MVVAVLLILAPLQKSETPKVIVRKEVPFVGVASTETMQSLSTAIPRAIPKLMAFMKSKSVHPSGSLFVRYTYIDMAKGLDIVVGFPVSQPVTGSKEIKTGTIPGGRYVSLTHYGSYSALVKPNAELQAWSKKQGLTFAMQKGAKGMEFRARLEFYNTDPSSQPDPKKWETEILYLIK